MRSVPDDILARFEAVLQKKGIAKEQHPDYSEWPRSSGHSGVRTIMIYTHCVPSRAIKEIGSPLDF